MKKILIVDDDRLITKVYERHFRNDGFDVRVANGGRAGLQAVRDFGPDAVLLDLNMPDLNGTDWLTEVRSEARFARLPVLVLTAATIGWQVWAASNMEVAFMFKKNAVPKEVVQAINDAITVAHLDATEKTGTARPERSEAKSKGP